MQAGEQVGEDSGPHVARASVIPNELSSPSTPVCPVTEFGYVTDMNSVSRDRARFRWPIPSRKYCGFR